MVVRRGRSATAENTIEAMPGRSRARRTRQRSAVWIARTGAILTLLVTASGCPTTRLPSILPGPQDADKRSFNVHDPLPETDIGPDMGIRPRGFMQERSEPRRTQEAQGLLGMPPRGSDVVPAPAGPVAPGAPMVAPPGPPGTPATQGSQLYPDAVPQ